MSQDSDVLLRESLFRPKQNSPHKKHRVWQQQADRRPPCGVDDVSDGDARLVHQGYCSTECVEDL